MKLLFKNHFYVFILINSTKENNLRIKKEIAIALIYFVSIFFGDLIKIQIVWQAARTTGRPISARTNYRQISDYNKCNKFIVKIKTYK